MTDTISISVQITVLEHVSGEDFIQRSLQGNFTVTPDLARRIVLATGWPTLAELEKAQAKPVEAAPAVPAADAIGDYAAVEAIARAGRIADHYKITFTEYARAILAAIRAGEVPGVIWSKELVEERDAARAEVAALKANRWTRHTPCCNGGLNEACDCPVSMTHAELAQAFINEVSLRSEMGKYLSALLDDLAAVKAREELPEWVK